MKKVIYSVFTAVLMVVVMTSCGKLPQAQIDEANAAIEAAKAAQADVYLPADFAALQDSMKAINAYIEGQKSKLFKKYGPAVEDLKAVVTLAKSVQENAVAKKEEVKKEVENLMAEVKGLVEETDKLFAKAPKGKEGKAALEQMKAEMATVSTAVTEAQTQYDQGAYMDALNKVKAAMETATRVNGELKEAIRKAGGRI